MHASRTQAYPTHENAHTAVPRPHNTHQSMPRAFDSSWREFCSAPSCCSPRVLHLPPWIPLRGLNPGCTTTCCSCGVTLLAVTSPIHVTPLPTAEQQFQPGYYAGNMFKRFNMQVDVRRAGVNGPE